MAEKTFVIITDADSGFAGYVNMRYVRALLPLTHKDRIEGASKHAQSAAFLGDKAVQCREGMDFWEKVLVAQGLTEPPQVPDDAVRDRSF